MDKLILNEEQKEALMNCGAFDYRNNKIANILEIDIDVFEHELNIKNSEVSLMLQKGKDMYNYSVDKKLFDLVQSGDLSALKELENRKFNNKLPECF